MSSCIEDMRLQQVLTKVELYGIVNEEERLTSDKENEFVGVGKPAIPYSERKLATASPGCFQAMCYFLCTKHVSFVPAM